MLRYIFFSLTLSISFPILSQTNYEVTHYTVEDGLMSNEVKQIIEDKHGVIWVRNGLGFSRLLGDEIENITGIESENDYSEFQIYNTDLFNSKYILRDNHLKKRVLSKEYILPFTIYENGVFKTQKIKSEYPQIDNKGYTYIFHESTEDTTWLAIKPNNLDTIDLLKRFNLKINEIIAKAGPSLIRHNSPGNFDLIDFESNTSYPIQLSKSVVSIKKYALVDSFHIAILAFDKELNNSGLTTTYYNEFGERIEEEVKIRNYRFYIYNFNESQITDSLIFAADSWLNIRFESKLHNYSKALIKLHNYGVIEIENGLIEILWNNLPNRKLIDFAFDHDGNAFGLFKNQNLYYIRNKKEEHELPISDDFESFLIDRQENIFIFGDLGLYKLSKNNYNYKIWSQYKGQSNSKDLYNWMHNQSIKQSNTEIEIFFDLSATLKIFGLVNDSLMLIDSVSNFSGAYSDQMKWNNKLFFHIDISKQNKYVNTLLIIDSGLNVRLLEVGSGFKLFKSREALYLANDQGIFQVVNNDIKSRFAFEPNSKYLPNPIFSLKRSASESYFPLTIGFERKVDSAITSVQYSIDKNEFIEDRGYDGQLKLSPVYIKDNLWFSNFKNTDSIIFVKGDKVQMIDNASAFLADDMGRVIEDNYENLIISSSEGICVIPSTLDTILKPSSDLFSAYIKDFALTEDKKTLWVYTSQGIHRIKLNNDLLSNPDIKTLPILHTRGYKIELEGDSILKVYNKKGIGKLKIGNNQFISNAAELYFKGLRINYNRIENWSEYTDHIVQDLGNTMPFNITFPYNKNHLTFDYQGVSHTNKQPLIYFHQLEGMDTNFVGTTSKSATYSNLEPGDYTFKVFAQDENNNTSRVISCTFSIAPPYWETWWFISLVIIIGGGVMYTGYQWRVRALKARQLELVAEVDKATFEIREQKAEIEEAHREITDSIAYAKRIQGAILPPLKLVKEYLAKSFVLYKPKDVVAGDFYWMQPEGDTTYFAAADCTGHGVPGAMVSVVCNNALNRSVKEFGLKKPGEILDKTRELVITEFEKSEEDVKDGMDIALVSLSFDKDGGRKTEDGTGAILQYAGAHNPLWIIRKGATEIEEIKANKQPIGKFDEPKPYTNHEIDLKEGDTLYVFSDGYVDQFGGEKGKKFKSLNFKRLLLSIQDQDMESQRSTIDEAFENWKGELEQIDDVCVIGVRL